VVAITSSAGRLIRTTVSRPSRSRPREPAGWPERTFQLTARNPSKLEVEGGVAARIQWLDT
jgi:hypothetical protein